MNSQTTVELIVACVTFFMTVTVNAVIVGVFMGGIRGDVKAIRDRLARLEGAFTIVPNITINQPAKQDHD